jgi:hypothetical protein
MLRPSPCIRSQAQSLLRPPPRSLRPASNIAYRGTVPRSRRTPHSQFISLQHRTMKTLTAAIKEDHEEMYEYHALYEKAREKGDVDAQERYVLPQGLRFVSVPNIYFSRIAKLGASINLGNCPACRRRGDHRVPAYGGQTGAERGRTCRPRQKRTPSRKDSSE